MSLSVATQQQQQQQLDDDQKKTMMSKQELQLRNLTKTFTGIEKPLKNQPAVKKLSDLIEELHRVFEGDHVNIEYVNHLMLSYQSNPSEWKRFAKFDRFRYTRNLVDAGNGKFNLMILCWGPGHGSAIHDHADSHCLMKMLSGKLSEVRYAWPKVQEANGGGEIYKVCKEEEGEDAVNGEELEEISRYTLEHNEVCYINDTLGLHRVENPDHSNGAVSLHLYCPPFDACSVFNKNTGKQTKANVTFWSVNGQKVRETKAPEDN